MKVFHVITGLKSGGAEAILFRIVLSESFHLQHEVVSLSDDGFYAPLLRNNGIKVTSLKINSLTSLIVGFIKLIKLIKSNKPDVVQTWMYHADIIGGLAAKLAGIKKIYWGVHSTFLNPEETKFLTKLAVKVAKFLSYNIPFRIICCSDVALMSHTEIGYDANKMIVINNGFDTKKFVPDLSKRNLIRKSLNIDSNVFVLGMVARWHPVKDHQTLLCALQKIISSKFKWKCFLIGHGMDSDNNNLKLLIDKYGLENFVFCMGPRKDIPDILNSLDVHILSSSSESFGNVTAEAMSCSIPCIMTDVGEAKRMIAEFGWIVQTRNCYQLAETIQSVYHVYSDTEKWHLLKSLCRKKIIDNYSIDNMIHGYSLAWSNENYTK